MTGRAWPKDLERPPMCPGCAQATLDTLIARRQKAEAEGDRGMVETLGQEIGRMLTWRFPCAEPGWPSVVTLGQVVVYEEKKTR